MPISCQFSDFKAILVVAFSFSLTVHKLIPSSSFSNHPLMSVQRRPHCVVMSDWRQTELGGLVASPSRRFSGWVDTSCPVVHCRHHHVVSTTSTRHQHASWPAVHSAIPLIVRVDVCHLIGLNVAIPDQVSSLNAPIPVSDMILSYPDTDTYLHLGS